MRRPDIRLHFNRDNGIFSARDVFTRETLGASPKNAEPSITGAFFEVSKGQHILMSRSVIEKARAKKRPLVYITETNWPRLRLAITWFKEEVLNVR